MSTRKIFVVGLLIVVSAFVVSGAPDVLSGAAEVKIVFSDWHLTEPHWEQALKEGIALFKVEEPKIDVTLDYVSYGEKEVKYITAIEAGAGPDVLHLHAYSGPLFMGKGYVLDLTDFIKAERPTFYGAPFEDAWFPTTLELMKKGDRYYALPGDFMAMILLYNTKLFKEAGLDPAKPPKTWREFLTYAKKLTRDRDGDGKIDTWGFGTVGKIDPGFELRFTPVLLSHGGDYLTPDNKCCALNTPAAKEAFKFWIELFTVHKVIPPGVTDMSPGKVREQMAAEKVAMKLSSGWGPPIIDKINPGLKAFEVLEAAPIPVKAGTDPKFRTTAWLSSWFINKNTKHPKEAWTLLKFITSKPMEEKWFMDARVLSARKDVSAPVFKYKDVKVTGYNELLNDKFAKVIAGDLERAKFVPQIVEWPKIIEAVNIAMQEGYIGKKDAMTALRDAYTKINEILSVYRAPGEKCPPF